MSSDEEGNGAQRGGEDDARAKKRRIQRACDICRRKKIRCDGSQMVNNRCSNCLAFNYECTYVEAAKKRGPPKGYVESLELRLEKMDKLIQRLCPGADFSQELGGSIDRDTWMAERERPSPTRRLSRPATPPRSVGAVPTPSSALSNDEYPSSEDEAEGILTLPTDLRSKLTLDQDYDRRFHGKSSGVSLLQAARQLKSEYADAPLITESIIPASRRPDFWKIAPWEKVLLEEDSSVLDTLEFPVPDLLAALVDSYFRHFNIFLPLIHRPTFEAHIRDGLHKRSVGFAGVLLLMCALGSKFSDDTRCYVDETKKASAGWQYFHQALHCKKSMFTPPSLHNLQGLALLATFLQACSTPHAAWQVIGIGIRRAQDRGAHRKKVYRAENRLDDEQWKRAWWVLVALDRNTSAALGRPCACQDEDFDVDYPVEVDDEYWHNPDPSRAFKQPEGKVSLISFFNCHLRLLQILSFALRTIYAINKSKVLLGFVGPKWEQHIVSELDSALNKWIDSVPEHLKWDPTRENILHFDQSVCLYASYYHIQILVHRPFIPSPRKPSTLLFPSLAICTNAARACSHMMDIHRKRSPTLMTHMIVSAFTSAIVLLISVWGANKTGTVTDPSVQLRDVQKCIQTLASAEDRFIVAGRLIDILRELASFGELPLAQGSPSDNAQSAHQKRERDSDTPNISSKWDSGNGPVSSSSDMKPTTGRSAEIFGEYMSPTAESLGASMFPDAEPGQKFNPRAPYQPARRPSASSSVPSQSTPSLSTPSFSANSPTSDELACFNNQRGSFPGGSLSDIPSSSQPPVSQPNQPYPTTGRPSASYDAAGPAAAAMSYLSEGNEGMFFGGDSSSFTNALDPLSNVGALFTLSEPDAAFITGQTQYPAPQYPTSSGGLSNSDPLLDTQSFDMWSGGATGYQWNDWGSYLNQVHPQPGSSYIAKSTPNVPSGRDP